MPPKAARPPKKGSKAAATKSGKVADVVVDDKAEVPAEESQADRLRKDGIVTTYAHSSKKMHRNVRDISVSNLTVTFHGSPLVEDTELTLNYGNRYGYIGRNGCGKTTFMKVIGARCFPIPDGIDIFHLKEEIEATEMTAKEAVMSVDNERATLEREAEEINDFLVEDDGGEGSEEAMDRLNQVYERLEELDAATAETRASKILCGLGELVHSSIPSDNRRAADHPADEYLCRTFLSLLYTTTSIKYFDRILADLLFSPNILP